MKRQYNYIKKALLSVIVIACAAFGLFVNCESVNAFGVSPMNQTIVLNPGDSYYSSFKVINNGTDAKDFSYIVLIQPYYTDENDANIFDAETSYNLITDWITIVNNERGTIAPGGTAEVEFVINVPLSAPAGGQYASLTVMSDNSANSGDGFGIQENMAIAHLVYAEITGETVRGGEFMDISVPGIVLSGDIKGTSTVKNVGNVHGTANYQLQVFPLFSNEEVYTTGDEPEHAVLLPDRAVYKETVWDKTPEFGIFNVIYTVEFEGVTEQVSKMVIKCPIWMMFLVLFGVAAIIAWLFVMTKNHRKARR